MSRVIKRYDNRKLYDTEEGKYVSLEEIAKLIRRGVDIQVMDNTTGDDLTTQTLTQVIFEEGKKGRNPLSKDLLHNVIRLGSNLLDGSMQQVRHGLDQLVPEPLHRILTPPSAMTTNEMNHLKQRVETLEAAIKTLLDQRLGTQQNDSS